MGDRYIHVPAVTTSMATTTSKTIPKRRQTRITKRDMMLADPDVRRWYDNLARGSYHTAEGSLRQLRRFCQANRTSPKDFADLAARDIRTATDMMEDFITVTSSEGYSPGYIHDIVKAVKSWLRHHEIEIRRKMKIGYEGVTPTLREERVPDAAELKELYAQAEPRTSAIIALMSGSGVRPEVLGFHDGSDGLRVGDLADVKIAQGRITMTRDPCMVVVRAELSKTRRQYFTFIGGFAASEIIEYLNDRIEHGEQLSPDSPVISPKSTSRHRRGSNANKAFLPTMRVSGLVRKAIRGAFGERKLRPYALRAFFATNMLVAEARGKIAHDFHVFWMGHSGGMQSRYTTNKGMLPDVLMDEMRAAYARAEPMLAPAGASTAKVVEPIKVVEPEPTQPSEQDHQREIDHPNQPNPPAEMAIRVVTDPAGAMKLLAMGWRIVDAPEQGKIALELDSNPRKQDSNPQNMDSNPQNMDSHPQSRNSQPEKAGLEPSNCGLAPSKPKFGQTRTLRGYGSRGIRTLDSRIKSPVRYLAAL